MEWKPISEIEEERRKMENEMTKELEEKAKREAERQRKIEEIKASTDPSMDEIGVVYIGQEDDIRDGYRMEITRRENELSKLGALNLYELYNKREKEQRIAKIQKIREASTSEELEKLGVYGDGRLETLKTSDDHWVDVKLTAKESKLRLLGGLTQAEIDEICYREAPMSFWKIKKAITKFHERITKKETTNREDEGER